jgi:TAG lipase/steryl ester hydrolase/phospholipase A2/LPA acyltransferase
MESSDDAVLTVLSIGPSTVLGRVLALKLLFCGWVREGRVVLWAKVLRVVRVWKRLLGFWFAGVFAWLNPRNPSVLLIAAVAATVLLGRAKMQSQKMERAYRRKFWSNLMKSALTYEEWAHAARMLDKDKGRRKDSDLYDEDLVRAKLNELRLRRLEGSVEDILFCIRADLVRNLGNMCNPELHKGRLQTPRLIQEYINEVR